jgi:Protein of unknown function (DUF3579)
MLAATPSTTGTIRAGPPWPAVVLSPDAAAELCSTPMIPAKPRQLHIQGLTRDGKTFRPSDWAERLAGAMSCFRPGGAQGGIGAFIGYSPFCVPHVVDGVKCVIVSEELRAIEPMAWDFVMSFARDNDLRVAEVQPLPMASVPPTAQ